MAAKPFTGPLIRRRPFHVPLQLLGLPPTAYHSRLCYHRYAIRIDVRRLVQTFPTAGRTVILLRDIIAVAFHRFALVTLQH